ncbi:MAG: phosphoribosyltransferase family protein [Bacilli bacterium]
MAERGFNHVIKMVEQTKLPICDCLLKTENIKQAFLSKTQREKMKKDIKIKPGMSIPKRILLVDDVLTTGNTMMGALEALQGIDVKIKILVVANHPLNLRNKQERLF